MRRMFRYALLGVVAATLMIVVVPADEAVCQDCRPAPENWACNYKWGTCPLWYKPCQDLPLTQNSQDLLPT